ncbi:MAG: VCBS repeat-containing protein [Thermodesulfovibrionia bacterium]|nr:VCBS repeat-containing protein [Thermodesulfovibrionia bacterium]
MKKDKKVGRVQPIRCTEDTVSNFNISGIRALPFIRTTFYDMNGDGLTDMIAGSKYGLLHLYSNSGDTQIRYWNLITGFFKGVDVRAFSAPAVGDIDGDRRAEVIVGTGGFSSDSGRILFFKNKGTGNSPKWKKVKGPDIKIGNDAAVTLVDFNFDGKPDIIAGNSEGKIFFFKNASTRKEIRFIKDKSLFIKRSFHMYAVPTAIKVKDRVILIVGNSLGKLYMFEIKKNKKGLSKKRLRIKLPAKSFLTPSFANLLKKNRFDLVLADSDGVLSYFENTSNDFTVWKRNRQIFNNRLFAGPACSPTLSHMKKRMFMVVGNIDGTLRLYEYNNNSKGLPWVEKKNYLKGIKMSGFSRGILTYWKGREILITGESSGHIKAFLNKSKGVKPLWKEEKRYFKGIDIHYHSTPAIFDINGDGKWELITGAQDGRIYSYRIKKIHNGLPVWEKIDRLFDNIKVGGFSTPSVVRDKNTLYLFVGQQDGHIRSYTAALHARNIPFGSQNKIIFRERNFLKDIKMYKHSSPFIRLNNGVIELVSGDYDGNIRHFTCNKG